MPNILILIILWAIIWLSFNAFFKWKIEKTHRTKYFWTSIFFLTLTAIVIFAYLEIFTVWGWPLIGTYLFATFVGFFFSEFYPFYKHIKNGRYYLASLPSNILMQQSMVLIAWIMLNRLFFNSYQHYYLGILFMILHMPIIFLKWAKLRYLYLVLTLLAGTVFSYLYASFDKAGLVISFLIHYGVYILSFYYLKDERKM